MTVSISGSQTSACMESPGGLWKRRPPGYSAEVWLSGPRESASPTASPGDAGCRAGTALWECTLPITLESMSWAPQNTVHHESKPEASHYRVDTCSRITKENCLYCIVSCEDKTWEFFSDGESTNGETETASSKAKLHFPGNFIIRD